jgi:DNA-binding transcriptional LysR family regulator
MLDAHQLNVFQVAAQALNFSEAARRLHMSQPSVSQHIQSLEQRFGTQLFERKGRHLTLTEAGETLLPLAREMVNRSIHIEETMASLRGDVYGHLTIACCTTAGRFLLPKLLARFREIYPHVQVTCHVTDQETGLGLLCDGKLHIAVASDREAAQYLEYRRFITDPVILVVNPSHPWANRREIEPEELLEVEFISREMSSGTTKAVSEGLANLGMSFDQLKTVMVLGTSQAISMAVQEGVGVAFITRLAVESALNRGDLVQIAVRGLELTQEVWVGKNGYFPSTQAQSAFWNFVNDPENVVLKSLRVQPEAEGMEPSAPSSEESRG